nr:MAG: hypothetical protein H2Bulk34192_000002 [Mitovirus sp.]
MLRLGTSYATPLIKVYREHSPPYCFPGGVGAVFSSEELDSHGRTANLTEPNQGPRDRTFPFTGLC